MKKHLMVLAIAGMRQKLLELENALEKGGAAHIDGTLAILAITDYVLDLTRIWTPSVPPIATNGDC